MDNFLTSEIQDAIKKHAFEDVSSEAIGFIININGDITTYKCKNISNNIKTSFLFSPIDIENASKLGRIIAFYHTHPSKSNIFSELDIKTSDFINLPIILYFFDGFNIHIPKKKSLVEIRLHGKMGEIFGKKWNLSVKSVGEAVGAIEINTKHKFYNYLIKNDKFGHKYQVLVNNKDVIVPKSNDIESVLSSELVCNFDDLESIDIIPIIEGGNAIGNLIIGVLLIVAAIVIPGLSPIVIGLFVGVGVALISSGIMSLLIKPPSFDGQLDSNKNKTSYLFNGPQNTIDEGGPVPIGYGRLLVGSQVISASYKIRNIDANLLMDIFDAGTNNISFNYDSISINLDGNIIILTNNKGIVQVSTSPVSINSNFKIFGSPSIKNIYLGNRIYTIGLFVDMTTHKSSPSSPFDSSSFYSILSKNINEFTNNFDAVPISNNNKVSCFTIIENNISNNIYIALDDNNNIQYNTYSNKYDIGQYNTNFYGCVNRMKNYDGLIYVGGKFTTNGSKAAMFSILKQDGTFISSNNLDTANFKDGWDQAGNKPYQPSNNHNILSSNVGVQDFVKFENGTNSKTILGGYIYTGNSNWIAGGYNSGWAHLVVKDSNLSALPYSTPTFQQLGTTNNYVTPTTGINIQNNSVNTCPIQCLTLSSDQTKLYVGGSFGISGTNQRYLTRLNIDNINKSLTVDNTFNCPFTDLNLSTLATGDINTQLTATRIAESNGSVSIQNIYAVKEQLQNGKVLVGGSFQINMTNGTYRGITRVDNLGNFDLDFNQTSNYYTAGVDNGTLVNSIEIIEDTNSNELGQIFIGGNFNTFNGALISGFAVLNNGDYGL